MMQTKAYDRLEAFKSFHAHIIPDKRGWTIIITSSSDYFNQYYSSYKWEKISIDLIGVDPCTSHQAYLGQLYLQKLSYYEHKK